MAVPETLQTFSQWSLAFHCDQKLHEAGSCSLLDARHSRLEDLQENELNLETCSTASSPRGAGDRTLGPADLGGKGSMECRSRKDQSVKRDAEIFLAALVTECVQREPLTAPLSWVTSLLTELCSAVWSIVCKVGHPQTTT